MMMMLMMCLGGGGFGGTLDAFDEVDARRRPRRRRRALAAAAVPAAGDRVGDGGAEGGRVDRGLGRQAAHRTRRGGRVAHFDVASQPPQTRLLPATSSAAQTALFSSRLLRLKLHRFYLLWSQLRTQDLRWGNRQVPVYRPS